jgi:hypothetical protein
VFVLVVIIIIIIITVVIYVTSHVPTHQMIALGDVLFVRVHAACFVVQVIVERFTAQTTDYQQLLQVCVCSVR